MEQNKVCDGAISDINGVYSCPMHYYMGCFVMFRNRVYALVTMLIFAAVEQFIYSHIDIHSVWNGLHYINIINIININATFSSYRNWGVGTYVFPVFSVVLFVHIICAGVIGYIAINVSASMKPYKIQHL